MKNPLYDKDFLYELDQQHNRETYAKIVALTFEENPVEQIEGKVTGGSINIDGTSSVRRTCNLTLVAQDVNINNYYWGLTNKFSLEIGLKNTINPEYPDIIWFKQGIFVITGFNTSLSTNNYTISINGKDKMCLLNGDIGGALPASIDFGSIQSYDTIYQEVEITEPSNYYANKYYILNQDFTPLNGKKQYIPSTAEFDESETYYRKEDFLDLTKLPLKTILREAIHTYGYEAYHNIIINDLEDYGLELLEYRGETPIYFLYQDGIITNSTINGDTICYRESNLTTPIKLSDLNDDEIYTLVNNNLSKNQTTKVKFQADKNGSLYEIAKVTYGQTAGYRQTDLTYAGDLISSIGETLTSIFDKIKNMLGEFEYFYDLDGHFVFQRKKTYVNTSWNTIVNTDDNDRYVDTAASSSAELYSFEDNNLITSFSNNPALNNLKNDYSVWGKRKGVSGIDIPIHMRYSIHNKPTFYRSFDGTIYCTSEIEVENIKKVKEIEIYNNFVEKVKNYTPEHTTNMPATLIRPSKNEDGSWTNGWWDIRDWYQYYTLLKGEEPNGTMKWYSYNSVEGCVPVSSVSKDNYYQNSYTWLIVVSPNGSFNFQHGIGNPYSGHKTMNTYYESYYDPNIPRGYKTEKKLIDGKLITKEFIEPYSGCSDTHTFIDFLENDIKKQGNSVYFYNPQFPNMTSFENLIKEEVNAEVEEYFNKFTFKVCDWREIIYQMAVDYYKYSSPEGAQYKPSTDFRFLDNKVYYGKRNLNGKTIYEPEDNIAIGQIIPKETIYYEEYAADSFLSMLIDYNTIITKDEDGIINQVSYYPQGITGYETYYTDLQGFWRQLYNPDVANEDSSLYGLRYDQINGKYVSSKEWIDKTLGTFKMVPVWMPLLTVGFSCDYYLPMSMYDEIHTALSKAVDDGAQYEIGQIDPSLSTAEYNKQSTAISNKWKKYLLDFENDQSNSFSDKYAFWNKNVIQHPELMNFWIDFLDDGSLQQYSIPIIGHRPKAVNDNNVSAIYFRETPDIIFINREEYNADDVKSGYVYIFITSNMKDLFNISAQGKSAKNSIDELIYQFSYCIENITLNAIPVFYLEPNARISVHDDKSQINGEYIVSKISLPLNYNGTMSITASKAVDRIY